LAIGEHFGYQRAGIVHRRIAALGAWEAAFIDEVRGHGEHRLTLRWLVPHTDLVQRPATGTEQARFEELHEAGLSFGYDAKRCVAVRAGGEDVALFAFGATLPWGLSVIDTDSSPGYGEKISAKEIALELLGGAPARLFTAVLFLHAR
jgi:hypothetical protein